MSEDDPEIAKIMQKKMNEMLKPKSEPKIEPGIIDLNDSNFDQTISAENPTLVDFGQSGVVHVNLCIQSLRVSQRHIPT